MTEGINMGRRSPWTKNEYMSLYKRITDYALNLSSQLLRTEGVDSASEAIAAYNIYKCVVVYLFIHCVSSGYDNCGIVQSHSEARCNGKARLWKVV